MVGNLGGLAIITYLDMLDRIYDDGRLLVTDDLYIAVLTGQSYLRLVTDLYYPLILESMLTGPNANGAQPETDHP